MATTRKWSTKKGADGIELYYNDKFIGQLWDSTKHICIISSDGDYEKTVITYIKENVDVKEK